MLLDRTDEPTSFCSGVCDSSNEKIIVTQVHEASLSTIVSAMRLDVIANNRDARATCCLAHGAQGVGCELRLA